MPDYIPGQGILYVQPRTVPVGPLLAYDKAGHLISTMYMVPIRDLRAHRDFEDLVVAPGMKPQRVQLYCNDAHPGVAEAHTMWSSGTSRRIRSQDRRGGAVGPTRTEDPRHGRTASKWGGACALIELPAGDDAAAPP
jgi:hypothetical protein